MISICFCDFYDFTFNSGPSGRTGGNAIKRQVRCAALASYCVQLVACLNRLVAFSGLVALSRLVLLIRLVVLK